MEVVFKLPVDASPELTLVGGPWTGRRRVLVDGTELPGVRRGRVRVYAVTLADGNVAQLELRNRAFDTLPSATVLFGDPPAPLSVAIGRPLAWWEYLVAALPILLIFGGILGGIFGVVAAYTNLRIIRSSLPAFARVCACVATFVAAGVLYVLVVGVLALLLRR